jgi:predicted transcriptional regulator
MAEYGLAPEGYRARRQVKDDDPVTAPAYSESPSALAKQLVWSKACKKG